jgi:hypothetical protein
MDQVWKRKVPLPAVVAVIFVGLVTVALLVIVPMTRMTVDKCNKLWPSHHWNGHECVESDPNRFVAYTGQ